MNPVKHLIASIALFCAPAFMSAQVGTGVVFLDGPIIAFPPTPVDSVAMVEIPLYNDVGAEQTVTLTGPAAPFSTPETAITISAYDTVIVPFHFQPLSTGSFASSLTAQGNIFGSATLYFTGSGTLASYTFTPDTVDIGTSPVNQAKTASFAVNSTGDGPIGLFNGQSSHPSFSVTSELITIAEGGSASIDITFFSEQNGNFEADITFETNAPQAPTLTVHVTASAITEVSGDVCGTWTLENSPYTLVGDVTVSSVCSLTVEAGVEILGTYDIIAEGPVHFLGTESQPILSETKTIQLLQADTASFTHTDFLGAGNLFSESFENASGTGSYNHNSPWTNNQYWTCLDSNTMSFASPNPNYDGPVGGCDYVYSTSSSSIAGSGSYYYRFSSTDYSGTLISSDYVIPKSGEYDFSLLYFLALAKQECEFKVGYQLNDGPVEYAHRTYELQDSYHTGGLGHRLAQFPINASAGDTLRMILTNQVGGIEGHQDNITVYFDALRLNYRSPADELVAELNWTDSTAFSSFSSNTANGDSLLFGTDETGDRYVRYIIDYSENTLATTYTPTEPGEYFLEWEDRVPVQETNKEPLVYVNQSGNTGQYLMHQHFDEYSTQAGNPYETWRKHIVNLGYFSTNQIIRVWFRNYNGNTGGNLEWHLKNFKLKRVNPNPLLSPEPVIQGNQTDIALHHVDAAGGVSMDGGIASIDHLTISTPENRGLQLVNHDGATVSMSNVYISNAEIEDYGLNISGTEIDEITLNNVHSDHALISGAQLSCGSNALDASIVLNHASFSDNQGYGLRIPQNAGLAMQNTTIDRNTNYGVWGTGLGDIHLDSCSVSDNNSTGFYCSGPGDNVSILNSQLDDNSGSGFRLQGASTDTTASITIYNSSLSRNGSTNNAGAYVYGMVGEIDIQNSSLSDNGSYGLYSSHGQSSPSGSAPLNLIQSDVSRNGSSGIQISYNNPAYLTSGDVKISGSTIQNNGSYGVLVSRKASAVEIDHTAITGNNSTGLNIAYSIESFDMDSVRVQDNSSYGILLSSCAPDSVVMNKVHIEGNGYTGIIMNCSSCTFMLDSCYFNWNPPSGSHNNSTNLSYQGALYVNIGNSNSWNITNTTIENCENHGIRSQAGATSLAMTNCLIQNNYQGIEMEFPGGGEVFVDSCTISGNTSRGVELIDISEPTQFTFTHNVLEGNPSYGFLAGGTAGAPSTAVIEKNTYLDNGINGAGKVLSWNIGGTISVFDNDASGNRSGAVHSFESSLPVNLTLSRDTITDCHDYMVTGSNTTAHIDSILLLSMSGSGLRFVGGGQDITLTHSVLEGNEPPMSNTGYGLYLGGNLHAQYNLIRSFNYGIHGSSILTSPWEIDNCLVAYNHNGGITHSQGIDLNYSSVIGNGGQGIYGGGFSTISNSLIWFNANSTQIGGSTYAIQYSNVQGINAQLTSVNYAWGDGCIGTDPVLTDSLGHYDPYSPCVDGGMPWEQDAHIPAGQGSSRADMGLYGGPANAYWGGVPPPDGAAVITDVFDIPQDQGGTVGLHFTASPFDFGGLGFNVTHYSIWRDLSLGSDAPTVIGDGNWEQIGTVPAQGFSQYGYTAETLVNASPGDSTCLSSFIVISHTTDDNIYWVSNVGAACSYDNLAPESPELDGVVLMDEPDTPVVLLSWPAPEEDDYAYTIIVRNDGAETNVVGDTLLYDFDVALGTTYGYTAFHIDINGNPSDAATVTLAIGAQRDVIPLSAGWNLISLDRTPLDAAVATVMADLEPGNLLYVTGFDAGASFYDPAGLPFLNTLSSMEDGYGYWVKVAADDTLRVEGAALPAGTLPMLDAGWNLVAYTAEGAASPATVFADLLAADELVYVTGFDGGVSIYDPAGLPFLNSLVAMQNGFGYWVKTVADYAGFGLIDDGAVMGDAAGAVRANPAFSFLNGTSDLGDRPGAFVDVIGPDGAVVGRMEVLPGGLLMTAAVYGDDPTTEAVEGLSPGDVLHFALDGRLAAETAVWQGDMGHLKLDLHFDVGSGMAVFPNPVTDQATIQFELAEAGRVRLELLDATGRVVEVLLEADMAAGPQQLSLDAAALAPGVYSLSLRRGDAEPMLTRIAIQ